MGARCSSRVTSSIGPPSTTRAPCSRSSCTTARSPSRCTSSAGGRTHTIARDLPAAGALRFAPDARQLVYVGRSPGGVAGLHVVALPSPRAQDSNPSHPPQGAIPRCLTNCILTTGALDESAFLPLPAGPADLAFDGDVVRYGVVRVAYRGAAE